MSKSLMTLRIELDELLEKEYQRSKIIRALSAQLLEEKQKIIAKNSEAVKLQELITKKMTEKVAKKQNYYRKANRKWKKNIQEMKAKKNLVK